MVRCTGSDGTRIVRHGELFDLTIAHVDCDAFYASAEKRDRPELAARPWAARLQNGAPSPASLASGTSVNSASAVT